MKKMKDSGVKWIGEIPKSWKLEKIKYITKIPITDGPHETPVFVDEGVPFYSVDGIQDEQIVYEPCRYISIDDANRYDKKEIPLYGDILMGKAASVGKIAVIDRNIRMQIWSPLAIIRTNEKLMHNIFLKYYLISTSAQVEIELRSTSNTQKNIAMADIENIIVPLANIKEQRLIGNFLDDKVGRIDEILKKLNNQIEILNKYKKSIIIETVTKGLNKNIKMKSTNIIWIKEIPEHWKIRKIKHLFINDEFGIKVGPFGSSLTDCVIGEEEGKYKIYGQANLIRKDFEFGDNFINEDNFKRLINYEVVPGDIAVSMMGTIGKCCVVPKEIKKGIMDSHLIKIRLNKKTLPKFFEYQYEGNNIFEQLLYYSNGSIMNGLNSSIVKNIYFAYPPVEEQKEIIEFLDKKCYQVNQLLEDKLKQIGELEKYKKSLIYEYVTGKKRVKGAEELYG